MRKLALPAALALLIAVVSGTPASADMGMPGMKPARPSRRVVAAEAFPDHVFVIYRPYARYTKDEKSGQEVKEDASEAEYAELTPDHPMVLAYDERARHSIRRVYLLIVPRAVAAPYKSALDLAKAVEARQASNAVLFEFPYKESVWQWSDPDITITYRVQRLESSDQLEVLRVPDKQFPCCALCLFACGSPVLMSLGGLWLIRRWQRRKITRAP